MIPTVVGRFELVTYTMSMLVVPEVYATSLRFAVYGHYITAHIYSALLRYGTSNLHGLLHAREC
jgi:hypothetical protein